MAATATKTEARAKRPGREVPMPDDPTVVWETVTPAEADELLARNGRNRTLNAARVQTLAGAIRRGEWKDSGETVKVSTNGDLLDGQHRLAAIVEADKPARLLVVRGLQPSVQDVVDIGRSRTFGDMLKIRGESNYAQLAAATRALWNYMNLGRIGQEGGGGGPTPQQLLKTLRAHEDGLREGLRAFHTIQHHLPGAFPSGYAAVYHLFSTVDEEFAEGFTQGLATGEDMGSTDPRYRLRERLIRASSGKMTDALRPRQRYAFAVKAFNFWVAGEEVQQLSWKPASGEPFPLVEGCPLNPGSGRRR